MLKKILILILAVTLFIASYYFFYPSRQDASFVALGNVPFRIVVNDRSKISFIKDIKAAIAEVDRLDNIFSSYLPGSELSLLNKSAGQQIVEVGDEIVKVIGESAKWYIITDGAFDITIKPLINLWTESSKQNKMPSKDEINSALSLIGFNKVDINNNKIRFERMGMSLDLGGIAKGTIVDRVVSILSEKGVKTGFVDGGGDINFFGNDVYNVGIKSPESNDLLMTIKCSNTGVVTSGNYARYSTIEGKKYSHILNPTTGWPLEDERVSISVVAPNAESADALATGLMVLGVEMGKKLIDSLGEGYGAVFVHVINGNMMVEAQLDNSSCVIY